jgi:hypothetical protein
MPKLITSRETVTIKLPETKGSVKMYSNILAGDYRRIFGGEMIAQQSVENSFKLVLSLIDSWDFTDKDDKPLSVSLENLDMLPLQDINKLADHANKVVDGATIKEDLKKNT